MQGGGLALTTQAGPTLCTQAHFSTSQHPLSAPIVWLCRYMADEARSLKAYGELPENSEHLLLLCRFATLLLLPLLEGPLPSTEMHSWPCLSGGLRAARGQ